MWTGFLSTIRYGSTGEYHATIGPHGTGVSGTAAVLTVYLSLPCCLYERVRKVARQSTLSTGKSHKQFGISVAAARDNDKAG